MLIENPDLAQAVIKERLRQAEIAQRIEAAQCSLADMEQKESPFVRFGGWLVGLAAALDDRRFTIKQLPQSAPACTEAGCQV